MPWRPGAAPVTIEVKAAEVVLGATVVTGPPAIPARVGAASAWAASCSQPKPSMTSTTTAAASITSGGRKPGGTGPGSKTAGMMSATQPPP